MTIYFQDSDQENEDDDDDDIPDDDSGMKKIKAYASKCCGSSLQMLT